MKLNKKVLTGALALAMGLGVAAPAVNSFAANNTSGQELVTNDYKKAEEAFVAVFNKNQELKASIPAKEKAVADAEEAVKEAKDADLAAAFVNNVDNYHEDVNEYLDDDDLPEDLKDNSVDLKDNSVVVEFNSLLKLKETKQTDFDTYVDAHSKDSEDDSADEEEPDASDLNLREDALEFLEADQKTKNTLKENYGDNADILMTAVGYAQAANTADKAVSDYRDKYENYEDKLQDAKDALQEAKDALAYAEGYDSSNEYKEAKDAFVKAGGEKAIIDKAEETGVYVPTEEDDEEEESVVEKIKAQLEVNKEKLAAAKGVKMYMPESYKLYKDRIDTAIANAEKAIKQAEDFLASEEDKTASLFTVAYAAEEEEAKTGEEVLKDLQDSEKELDSVLGDIEADSKEENDKNEEKEEDKNEEKEEDKNEEKEDDKNEEKEEDKNEEKEDDKVVVEKKEDVKASKNVKTGVAGVAGVGAVLAAASAAYVSSKRK